VTSVFAILWVGRFRFGRAPVVFASLFIVTLFPALGFINVFPFRYSFVADHFQYMAAVVIFVATAWAWDHVPKLVGIPLGIATLALLACISWHRQAAFYDLRSLWTDTVRQNPSAWIAWNNLGTLDYAEGDLKSAVHEFKRAAAIAPNAPLLQANLGNALLGRHSFAKAQTALTLAVNQDPNDATAWSDLATACADRGEDAQAKDAYRRAIQLNPNDPQPIADLAWLEATSMVPGVRDLSDAQALSATAEAESHGYSIRAIEARAAADAASGRSARRRRVGRACGRNVRSGRRPGAGKKGSATNGEIQTSSNVAAGNCEVNPARQTLSGRSAAFPLQPIKPLLVSLAHSRPWRNWQTR
jgi:Flp pilus assembly protein TadD